LIIYQFKIDYLKTMREQNKNRRSLSSIREGNYSNLEFIQI